MFDFRQAVHQAILRLGWDLHRKRDPAPSLTGMVRLMDVHGINLVFDVGANVGQFGRGLREGGYRGRIVSFEPASEAHRQLAENARGDAAWIVAPRIAIGAEDTQVALNVGSYSEANSLLPMLSLHTDILPGSGYTGTEAVRCARMDAVAPQYYISAGDRVLLKMDVQGFEKQVLDGAAEFLRQCRGVYLELSTTPLYGGQALINDMLEYLYARQFELWWMKSNTIDPRTGRVLQMDGLLFR